jgi:hypothetical protein
MRECRARLATRPTSKEYDGVGGGPSRPPNVSPDRHGASVGPMSCTGRMHLWYLRVVWVLYKVACVVGVVVASFSCWICAVVCPWLMLIELLVL